MPAPVPCDLLSMSQDLAGGFKPSAGDLSCYAPWGNLAIFHKGFEYSSGLIRLGRLETGLEAMRRKGPLPVVLTRERPRVQGSR